MAAIVVTAANVKASATAKRITDYNAGVAITAGQTIYLDSNQLWQLGSTATPGTAVPTAIAANNAAAGQRVDAIVEDSDFTHGAAGVAAGDVIWAHPTAGALTVTQADNVATNYVTVVAIAKSSTKAILRFLPSGVAK